MKFTPLILSLLLIISCKKATPTENSDGTPFSEEQKLNNRIASVGGSLSPVDIAKMYYPKEVAGGDEGNETITITTDNSKITTSQVTITHDNLLDDSIRGERYVLVMESDKKSWKVLSITKTWRCWRDGPDGAWGTVICS